MTRMQDSFEDVGVLFQQSWPGRALGTALTSTERWARSSRTAGLIVHAYKAIGELPRARRIRLFGFFLLAFAVTHLLLLFVVPPQSAPGLPRLFWLGVIAVSVGACVLGDDL